MINKKCPKCGGSLIFEAIGLYGDCFKVNKRTGKVCEKRYKRYHYEHEDYMLYCLSCRTTFNYKETEEGQFIIFGGEEDDES